MRGSTESAAVAIIGAGPYGLSLAAHLQAKAIRFRIFGQPMDSWLRHMPQGMLLKSDPFASNLADPEDSFTLERYSKERPIPYSEQEPVSLETFCDYGLAFQERYAPKLEKTNVVSVERAADGFLLNLENGATASARVVVVAVGVGPFRYVPPSLGGLPADVLSHSFDYHDLSVFRGARVAVVGGGASAIDTAALLHEQGCNVRLITRRRSLRFSGTASRSNPAPSLWRRLRHPPSGLGPGLRSFLSVAAPLLIHAAPKRLRLEFVRRHLGPAAAGVMKDKLIGKVPLLLEREIAEACYEEGEAVLTLRGKDGGLEVLRVDHVIAATGFRTDLRRLDLLGPSLRKEIAQFEHTPVLTSSFESSVPGLYFIGPAAAVSFGPLLRFAFGARFAARRLAPALVRSLERPATKRAESPPVAASSATNA